MNTVSNSIFELGKAIVDFSIVTPSSNMYRYLPMCHTSVVEQEKVTCEHIVCDAVSRDGTVTWLKEQRNIIALIEPDRGMYDAINKGFDRANGEFIAHLNCDEQYFLGALQSVKQFFDNNPSIDVLFCNAIMVSQAGELVAFRKSYPLRPLYLSSTLNLDVLTCSTFFRHRVIDSGIRYDISYKSIGDIDFITRILEAGFQCDSLDFFTSSFFFTGQNLSRNSVSISERERWSNSKPPILQKFRRPLKTLRWLEKLSRGVFNHRLPFEYNLYLPDDVQKKRRQVTLNSVSWGTKIGSNLWFPLSNRTLSQRE